MTYSFRNLFASAVLALIALQSFAVDRKVNEVGPSGSYATIAAALSASSPGDRILVYPRPFGAAYAGFNWGGGAIQILPAIEGQRYKVNTQITIGAITGPVLISGVEMTGSTPILGISSPASPQAIRIVNSYFNAGCHIDFSLNTINHIVHAQNDTMINNSYIAIAHGSITGCFLSNSSMLTWGNGASTVDTVKMIGNRVVGTGVFGYGGIYANSIYCYVYAEGNYINITSGANAPVAFVTTSLGAAGGNTLVNNTILHQGSSAATIQYGSGNCGKVNMRNNAIITVINQNPIISFNGGAPAAGTAVSYNYTTGAFITNMTNFANDGTNQFNTGTLTLSAEGAIASAYGVDDGDANPMFLDLDLTQNDVGAFGGSGTRANYITTDNGSRVLGLTAPRYIYSTDAVNVSGEGLDK